MTNNKTGATGGCEDPRIAFFDQLAPVWDTECSNPTATLQRLEALNADLGLVTGQDVLELGCGTGQITGFLANKARPGRVVAADFSPAMLDRARSRGIDAEFRQLDICSEAPVDDRFDVVLCFNAFPHFRDKPAALRQIGRFLKPSGLLTVLHLSGSGKLNAFHGELREPVCHDLLPGQHEWSDLLRDSGLCLSSFVDKDDLFLLQAKRA